MTEHKAKHPVNPEFLVVFTGLTHLQADIIDRYNQQEEIIKELVAAGDKLAMIATVIDPWTLKLAEEHQQACNVILKYAQKE